MLEAHSTPPATKPEQSTDALQSEAASRLTAGIREVRQLRSLWLFGVGGTLVIGSLLASLLIAFVKAVQLFQLPGYVTQVGMFLFGLIAVSVVQTIQQIVELYGERDGEISLRQELPHSSARGAHTTQPTEPARQRAADQAAEANQGNPNDS